MLTKADIKLLVDTFPTRAEFDKKIEEIKREMATKEELRELKDILLDRSDSLFTELKKIREEQAMHIGIHQRVDDDINSLKKRVGKLETSLVSVPH